MALQSMKSSKHWANWVEWMDGEHDGSKRPLHGVIVGVSDGECVGRPKTDVKCDDKRSLDQSGGQNIVTLLVASQNTEGTKARRMLRIGMPQSRYVLEKFESCERCRAA